MEVDFVFRATAATSRELYHGSARTVAAASEKAISGGWWWFLGLYWWAQRALWSNPIWKLRLELVLQDDRYNIQHIYSIYIYTLYIYIAYTSLGASGQRRPAWSSNFAQAEGLLGENPGWRRLGPSAGLHCSQLLQWVAEMGSARLHWSSWTQFLVGCYSGNSHFASWTLALSRHGW